MLGLVVLMGGAPQPVDIDYRTESDDEGLGHDALLATVGGATERLIEVSQEKCLEVVDVRDFDGDGSKDALVRDITACGGNCCPDGFFFVSRRTDGGFAITEELADSWHEPVIEEWKGRATVVVVSNNEGVNLEPAEETTRRFVLEGGKAVKVEESRRQEIPSLLDLRSAVFADGATEHAIEFDLDGDGTIDRIVGTLWERWGRFYWTVELGDGRSAVAPSLACKRLGVLATSTEGVKDLVCDQDIVIRWNGAEYVEAAEDDEIRDPGSSP